MVNRLTLPLAEIPCAQAYRFFRPRVRQLFKQIDSLARVGDFDLQILNGIRSHSAVRGDTELCYYLASLYLQLGERGCARELLENAPVRGEMKRYFAVLQYCREIDLPHPALSNQEHRGVDYLCGAIKPHCSALLTQVNVRNGFSVVGNAPGAEPIDHHAELCSFYFNDYRLNHRIQGQPSIHVVTPSWRLSQPATADALLITGNSIFHRRSRVWQQFVQQQHYRAIYTVPRTVWCELYRTLGTSPSAGLIVLNTLSTEIQSGVLDGQSLRGHVAGFSARVPKINHAYDSVPSSKHHNWSVEVNELDRCLSILKGGCAAFAHLSQ